MQRREKLILGVLLGIGGFWAWNTYANQNIDPATLPPDEPLPGVSFGIASDIESDLIVPLTDWKVNDFDKYASAIASAEANYGIPTDLLGRVLYQESRFIPAIVSGQKRSPVGALGIAQFMPSTAAQYGLNVMPAQADGSPDPRDQRLDPFASINAAAKYLTALYNEFSGNWQYALMAYNWGPGNTQHYLNGDINTRTGKPYVLPDETSTYIASVTQDIPTIA